MMSNCPTCGMKNCSHLKGIIKKAVKNGKGGPGIIQNPLPPDQMARMKAMGIGQQSIGATNSNIPGGMPPPPVLKKLPHRSFKGSGSKAKKATIKNLIFKSKSVKPRKPLSKLRSTKRKPVF